MTDDTYRDDDEKEEKREKKDDKKDDKKKSVAFKATSSKGKAKQETSTEEDDSWDDDDCNTLGVCHQLSNGFKLKHDMLSGDEGVKVKSTRVSSNLNLDNIPLLTMYTLVKIMQE